MNVIYPNQYRHRTLNTYSKDNSEVVQSVTYIHAKLQMKHKIRHKFL